MKSKRKNCLDFARFNGLEAKGCRRSRTVSLFHPRNNWVDCFDSWPALYNFLVDAVQRNRDIGQPFPWNNGNG